MWRPRLPSPFGATFLGVPTAFQLILHDLGFAPVQSDGEILVACCLEWVKKDKVANPDAVVFDPRPWTRIVGLAPDGNHVLVASDTYNLILARILGSQPQPLEEADLELATKTLQQLLFRAAGARQSHTYSPLEMEQAIRDREEWILSGSIEAPDVLAVANKWRHWKPGTIETQLPTSQRALEQHLRARWLERLLGYFVPFRHQIPYMHQVMGARELEEFGHLFGDARFRTIRAHCLAYEGMRKIGFQNLPWTAGDVRHLMNQAVTLEVTPAKLQKWWGTLKWLSIKLGMLTSWPSDRPRAIVQCLPQCRRVVLAMALPLPPPMPPRLANSLASVPPQVAVQIDVCMESADFLVTALPSAWRGRTSLHCTVDADEGTFLPSRRCTLMDLGLPVTFHISRKAPEPVCDFLLQIPPPMCSAFPPGPGIVAILQADLEIRDGVKVARPVWTSPIVRVPLHQPVAPFRTLHAFCGVFYGWAQALHAIAKLADFLEGPEVSVDVDATVAKFAATNHGVPLIVDTAPLRAWNRPPESCVVQASINDEQVLHCLPNFGTDVITASPPCPPWSRGDAKGLDTVPGFTWFEFYATARKIQSSFILLECVDTVMRHAHFPILQACLTWAGCHRLSWISANGSVPPGPSGLLWHVGLTCCRQCRLAPLPFRFSRSSHGATPTSTCMSLIASPKHMSVA